MNSAENIWLAGVDGCPSGWMVALVRPEGEEVRLRQVAQFSEIVFGAEAPAVVAVDIPIGLPERAGHGGRRAENLVRPLVGARQSAVFSVPSRTAVYARDYREACRIALATSEPPRKVSKQMFNIAGKIREVDEFLRQKGDRCARVFEVHPEVAFWRFNGEQPLSQPKKVRGSLHAAGLALRRKLLIAAGLPEAIVNAMPPAGVGADDLIDALACAAVARRIHCGEARPFPDPPERDACGLTMAIWA